MSQTQELKVAIVHEFMTKIGGAEKVLLALHEIFPKAPIFTLIYDKKGTKEIFKDCQIITSSLDKYPAFFKKRTKLFLPFYPKAIEEFNFSEYDIVISSSNSFAHGVITSPKTFHMSYCHSPMRYAWDYTNEYLAENKIGFGIKGMLIRNILHNIRIWDEISSYRVDKWIANSVNVKNRIKKYYGSNSKVIFPPSSIEKIIPSENLPDDYFLVVSRLEPYKKIDLVIKTFNKINKPLVIIGIGSQAEALKKIANKNIEFLGWQSEKSVYEYMRNAKALIFASEEDAGITPIESMAAGRPVIAFDKGGVTECVVDKKTGVLFQEQSEESLANAIEYLENNYLDFSPRECRMQAENFSKEKFKEKLLAELNDGMKEYEAKFKKYEK